MQLLGQIWRDFHVHVLGIAVLAVAESTKNPKFHSRTKHIDVHHHFIRELIENKEIVVEYVKTEEMLTDVFTKGGT